MKYVLAVSGGVDSVVLLDMVTKGLLGIPKVEFVVAHFDHGVRQNSGRDAKFVEELAKKYELEFYLGEGHLGSKASESSARTKRYEFLNKVARKITPDGEVKIITAHHQDDLIETILINLIRGTGWRGLAPFWSDNILRPMINLTKAEIVRYATENNLEWVEDETNFSNKYFRNRVRNISSRMTANQRQQLLDIYKNQVKLRSNIEKNLDEVNQVPKISDLVLLSKISNDVAIELLNRITEGKLTEPQLKRLLSSLKTAKSGDIFQPGGGIQVGVYKSEINISDL